MMKVVTTMMKKAEKTRKKRKRKNQKIRNPPLLNVSLSPQSNLANCEFRCQKSSLPGGETSF